MKDQFPQKYNSAKNADENADRAIFQKYPKNLHQNTHYKSIKEKIMTSQDQQEIIKIPFTLSSKKQNNLYLSKEIGRTDHKIQKYKGKKYQIIPMRTISYSTPQPYAKVQYYCKTTRIVQQNQPGNNKFASKLVFQNMKKLKDLRKENYKSRGSSAQKQMKRQQKLIQIEQKLDLFKLTSTNFKYQKKYSDDLKVYDSKNRKNQLQTGRRNTIKYKNIKITEDKIQKKLNQQILDLQCVMTENLNYLQPISFRNNRSNQIIYQQIFDQIFQKQQNHKSQKNREYLNEQKFINQKKIDDKQIQKIFKKYSQNIFETDVTLKKFINKSKNIRQKSPSHNKNQHKKITIPSSSPAPSTVLQKHVPNSFKASFRIKHIQDNKNILMTTIKKKSKSLSKNDLIQFIQKVVT